MEKANKNSPPALILGGSENALSITRSLGKRGIAVYVSVSEGVHALYSKYSTIRFPIAKGAKASDYWGELLFSANHTDLHGSVIFTGSDDGVDFVARNQKELEKHYVLDDSLPELHLDMLDKKKTLRMAQSIGMPIPNFWEIEETDHVDKILPQIVFPVIIKPVNSHLFQQMFDGDKYFFAKDSDDLVRFLPKALQTGLKFMISEFIPGPDTLLSSYYTYIDANDNPLFHFTKSVIRRTVKNKGLGCYHRTNWDSEVAQHGITFFKGIGYRGLGNIEFKKDLRDGCWKVIECNPRFTAAQELLVRSGMDISSLIYNHLCGLPLPAVNSYKQDLRLWYPVRDLFSLIELRKKKEITFFGWIKSLFHKKVLPFFRWSDPVPSIIVSTQVVKDIMAKKLGL
jgi:D-aspartate ligase